jgi:uncharacterized membrane protein
MNLASVYSAIVTVIELLGALIIVAGIVLAIVLALVTVSRGQGASAAVRVLRNVLGGAILLGLEVFVAADLIRTITEAPTVENMVSLGLIVIIRTILSFTIQIEIDGTLPWRKAVLTSGASVLATGVRTAKK